MSQVWDGKSQVSQGHWEKAEGRRRRTERAVTEESDAAGLEESGAQLGLHLQQSDGDPRQWRCSPWSDGSPVGIWKRLLWHQGGWLWRGATPDARGPATEPWLSTQTTGQLRAGWWPQAAQKSTLGGNYQGSVEAVTRRWMRGNAKGKPQVGSWTPGGEAGGRQRPPVWIGHASSGVSLRGTRRHAKFTAVSTKREWEGGVDHSMFSQVL